MLNLTFNQKLILYERTFIIEDFRDLNLSRLLLFKNLDGSDDATSCRISGPRSPSQFFAFLTFKNPKKSK